MRLARGDDVLSLRPEDKMDSPVRPPVGGGAKKILYALDTVRRMGPGKAAKALTS
jgi:hypothetical protein